MVHLFAVACRGPDSELLEVITWKGASAMTMRDRFEGHGPLPGTPYTATISGTFTSSYLNPNSFAIGENQPAQQTLTLANGHYDPSTIVAARMTFVGC